MNQIVTIRFPLNDNWCRIDAEIKKKAKELQGRNIGGGAGFGSRDIDFSFESKQIAEQFVTALSDVEGMESIFWTDQKGLL